MRAHAEIEQLSAYLDGELPEAERVSLEAHVAGCAECRSMLDGLRATVADLRALPDEALTPQESWALRGAIRRARLPGGRWQRVAWASGAVAAVAIGVVVLVLGPGGNRATRERALDASEASLANAFVYRTDANFDAATAQARLRAIATGGTETTKTFAFPQSAGGQTPTAEDGAAPSDAGRTLSNVEVTSADRVSATPDDLARCAQVVRDATPGDLLAVEFDIANYEGKPAFLLFFRAGDRLELWVMSRADCQVLFFAET